MYNFLLIFHNVMRWLVIIMAVYALYSNFTGWQRSRKFTRKDRALNTTFVGTLHLQFLFGLILYFFFSPIVKNSLQNMKTAMGDSTMRFWAVEHIAGMILAIVVAQVGNIYSKKGTTDEAKYKRAFIFFLISVILIVLSLPYAFHGGERPLNPFDHV